MRSWENYKRWWVLAVFCLQRPDQLVINTAHLSRCDRWEGFYMRGFSHYSSYQMHSWLLSTLRMKQAPSFSRRDTAWSALPGFERSLNSSCQSEACILCFRFFPGGFDVNPFHTSNTSVLLQAFLSFLSIQIYMGVGELWAVIVQLLKWDSNDKAHSISPHSGWVLTTRYWMSVSIFLTFTTPSH